MSNVHPTFAPFLASIAPKRFAVVYCSSCGEEFGPRDAGYSHCSDHKAETAARENQEAALKLQTKYQGLL